MQLSALLHAKYFWTSLSQPIYKTTQLISHSSLTFRMRWSNVLRLKQQTLEYNTTRLVHCFFHEKSKGHSPAGIVHSPQWPLTGSFNNFQACKTPWNLQVYVVNIGKWVTPCNWCCGWASQGLQSLHSWNVLTCGKCLKQKAFLFLSLM